MNKVTNTYTSDMVSCTDIPQSWSSSDSIATYIGFSPPHTTRIVNYLAKFQSEAQLGSSDCPTSQDKAIINFPRTLQ